MGRSETLVDLEWAGPDKRHVFPVPGPVAETRKTADLPLKGAHALPPAGLRVETPLAAFTDHHVRVFRADRCSAGPVMCGAEKLLDEPAGLRVPHRYALGIGVRFHHPQPASRVDRNPVGREHAVLDPWTQGRSTAPATDRRLLLAVGGEYADLVVGTARRDIDMAFRIRRHAARVLEAGDHRLGFARYRIQRENRFARGVHVYPFVADRVQEERRLHRDFLDELSGAAVDHGQQVVLCEGQVQSPVLGGEAVDRFWLAGRIRPDRSHVESGLFAPNPLGIGALVAVEAENDLGAVHAVDDAAIDGHH